MSYLVKTPWCSSNAVVPDAWDKATVEKAVDINTGSCPSGVTFNWHGFVRDLRLSFNGSWDFASKGAVSKLPWGNVSDCMVVVDSKTWQVIDQVWIMRIKLILAMALLAASANASACLDYSDAWKWGLRGLSWDEAFVLGFDGEE